MIDHTDLGLIKPSDSDLRRLTQIEREQISILLSSPEARKINELVFFSGVRIMLWVPDASDFNGRMLSSAPLDDRSYATENMVWFVPEDPEYVAFSAPVWLRLLHEVAHAATGRDGRVGDESYAAALELGFCAHVWGAFSPQVRECLRWQEQAGEYLWSIKQTWAWWRTSLLSIQSSQAIWL